MSLKMRYLVKKKKKIKECDSAAGVATQAPIDADMGFGMGPVVVNGGPDRWDNILSPAPKRRYRVKKNKRK